MNYQCICWIPLEVEKNVFLQVVWGSSGNSVMALLPEGGRLWALLGTSVVLSCRAVLGVRGVAITSGGQGWMEHNMCCGSNCVPATQLIHVFSWKVDHLPVSSLSLMNTVMSAVMRVRVAECAHTDQTAAHRARERAGERGGGGKGEGERGRGGRVRSGKEGESQFTCIGWQVP